MKDRIRNAWAVLRGRAVVCTHSVVSMNYHFTVGTKPWFYVNDGFTDNNATKWIVR